MEANHRDIEIEMEYMQTSKVSSPKGVNLSCLEISFSLFHISERLHITRTMHSMLQLLCSVDLFLLFLSVNY